jgi:hypothetical protein
MRSFLTGGSALVGAAAANVFLDRVEQCATLRLIPTLPRPVAVMGRPTLYELRYCDDMAPSATNGQGR